MAHIVGRAALVAKGAYSASVQYEKLDIVTHGGKAYLVIKDPPMGT